MTDADAQRSVTITRIARGRYAATNGRGGRIEFGGGDDSEFTPVELFLAAIGGCTGIDVDLITSRQAQPNAFSIGVDARKVRDERGNHLTDISVTFGLGFPDGNDGDAARAVLPQAVQRSHDRLCTVSRTVELGTSVATTIG